eukprot:1300415-Rhodomonas_salina.1
MHQKLCAVRIKKIIVTAGVSGSVLGCAVQIAARKQCCAVQVAARKPCSVTAKLSLSLCARRRRSQREGTAWHRPHEDELADARVGCGLKHSQEWRGEQLCGSGHAC